MKRTFDALVERAKLEADFEGFQASIEAFRKLRDEFQKLPDDEKQEIDDLHTNAQDRQMRKFLERFSSIMLIFRVLAQGENPHFDHLVSRKSLTWSLNAYFRLKALVRV